jgi:hypothetical protein
MFNNRKLFSNNAETGVLQGLSKTPLQGAVSLWINVAGNPHGCTHTHTHTHTHTMSDIRPARDNIIYFFVTRNKTTFQK